MDEIKNVTRRNMLRDLGTAAAALTVTGAASAAPVQAPKPMAPANGFVPGGVENLAQLRENKAMRSSSFDVTGGNADATPIEPGATITILDATGPGMITRFWATISSADRNHLKDLVLRMYWDGEAEPSVESPIGDFFGLGLGEYFLYQSALLEVAPVKALVSYFPMPFRKTAKFTATNEGAQRTGSFYYNIDYYLNDHLPADLAYFHANYRQATPTKGIRDDWTNNGQVNNIKNLTGENNYVFMEAQGRGHFVGVTHSILQNQTEWAGEGDEMIFVDDMTKPVITGTGTEDYYGGAWDFGGRGTPTPFGYQTHGAPSMIDVEVVGGRTSMYRWHLDNPICFSKAFKMTMETGHGNSRSDNWFTVAYWYQVEPHMPYPKMAAAADRIPRLMAVKGGLGPKAV